MIRKLYARWMYAWETKLTMQDTNRVVRPLDWGIEWTRTWSGIEALYARHGIDPNAPQVDDARAEAFWIDASRRIVEDSDAFFGHRTPDDFRLETRTPQLFPTNVRPRTLKQEAALRRLAERGRLPAASFLRFTSPVRTPYPENDVVNARWFPAPPERMAGKPRQAIVVLPQWNSDAFSHNALCTLFNRFGISALRLSKPYHDIRRPAEIERSDYAVSANIGRTVHAVKQAVADIRSCLDWLEAEGYEQFGILGTSLGSCYAFLASAHDPRLRVNAFNHASAWFGDVVWTGQSTRHIRAAFEGTLTRDRLRQVWAGVSPMSYMARFAALPKRVLVVYARYDLTFLEELSQVVVDEFTRHGIDFTARVLPCGHYTTGETPYKYMDGWFLGKFVHDTYAQMAREQTPQEAPRCTPQTSRE